MGEPEKTAESIGRPPAADADRLRKRRNNLAVMVLLGVDVLVGGGIAAAGILALQSDAIALAGAALATIGLILMVVYQLVGRER